MLYVRMTQDGYLATNDSGQELFDSGNSHERFFHFLEADTESMEKALLKYFNSVVNQETLELIDGKPNESALKKVKKELEALHPFLRHNDYFSIISEMLTNHFNYCLLKKPDQESAVSLAWYSERLKPLIKDLLHGSRYNRIHGDENLWLIHKPNKDLEYEFFTERNYKRYCHDFEQKNYEYSGVHGVLLLKRLQRQVQLQVYWLLDASARYFAKLTLDQRAALFRKVFSSKYGVADLKIIKYTSFSNPLRSKNDPRLAEFNRSMGLLDAVRAGTQNQFVQDIMDKKDRAVHENETRSILVELRDNSVELDPELNAELNQLIDEVSKDVEPAFYEEYAVDAFNQLLFLELEQMIKADTILKRCRQCDRYFITNNKNVEYCDRIASGETQPCSVIGSTRSFLKKMDEDPALKMYNRAYKTHYARKMKGLMTEDEFIVWRDEAKGKLDQVRTGDYDVDEFGQWLKL